MPLHHLREEPWKQRIPTLAMLRTCLDTELYRRLPDDHRERCEEQTRVFLDQVEILGILDHIVTNLEAVRVAFSCAVLYAGRPEWDFPPKLSVRISPMGFDKDYVPCAGKSKWAGWVCPRTAAVWIDRRVIDSSFRKDDSYHAPLHEFAHVLDFGVLEPRRKADGIPRDLNLLKRDAWLAALRRVRDRVSKKAERRVVDDDAARNPAESFACVVEAFFERPKELRLWDREVYQMVSDFLKQDPARG